MTNDRDQTAVIQRDPGKLGGKPTLGGLRFPIDQMLAELADGPGPRELAENYGLPEGLIRQALMEIANDYRR